MKLLAAIVTYNPDRDRLWENLAAVAGEVDEVVIVDNCSKNFAEVEALTATFENVRLIRHAENLGIAVALNAAMQSASAAEADWVLLLDQDSVCGPGMVAGLCALIAPDIGAIAPAIFDRNISTPSPALGQPMEINHCITSGAIYSVAAWRETGGYDNAMFMDFVDFDYCLRLRLRGFRILRNPRVFLSHELGSSVRYGPFIAYNHSATRSFHIARDMLYFARKTRNVPRDLRVHRGGIFFFHLLLLRKSMIIAVFEQDAMRRVLGLARGSIAGTFRRTRLSR
jgi:rhamnosyltransferase